MKPIAVSMGEPAGIGPEIILAAWQARETGIVAFYVAGDLDLFRALAAEHGSTVAEIATPEEAALYFATALPVLATPLIVKSEPGKPDGRNADAVIASIDHGVDACLDGTAAALVTAPIHKATLYDAGFAYPGHTEYLAHRAETAGQSADHLMLLAGAGLKVALVTIHTALRDVPELITTERLLATARLLNAGLKRDFGITRPRIAVAALNPHAGETGALGREEVEVIAPAIEAMKREGILATGPHPSDTLFHDGARRSYDAALCMYHDQALIPLKTLDFFTGVNVTLGLPLVRTSPDHGTALDIAGKGKADARSFIAALKLAAEIAERRGAAAKIS